MYSVISRKTVDGDPFLSYSTLDPMGRGDLNVEIRGSQPIKVSITPVGETVSETRIEEAKQDVVVAVELFEDNIRKNTLYFAWREGEKIVPEQVSRAEKKPINRIFLETQIIFFVIVITIGMFLFFFIGDPAVLAILALQFLFVFFSNKFVARTADWRITEENPYIHLLEYPLPLKEHDDFMQKYAKDKIVAMKKEVYEETIAEKGEISCENVQQVFEKYGFACKQENLSARKVNVYELVKKTADKFGFPMPEVVVANTMIPNAAASGPSPSRGVVLITTGLFVQLDDDEILSVLGHEFGHLKGRDPLFLYGLTAAQYLFTFFVVFPLFPFIFSSFLFLVYWWASMAVVYFIAKFFEARADLISAMVIGQPQTLAESLEKIGFRRLIYERVPSFRIQEWVGMDPHPPIYFRIARLNKLEVPLKIKYPLIQSIKDVVRGFFESLGI